MKPLHCLRAGKEANGKEIKMVVAISIEIHVFWHNIAKFESMVLVHFPKIHSKMSTRLFVAVRILQPHKCLHYESNSVSFLFSTISGSGRKWKRNEFSVVHL